MHGVYGLQDMRMVREDLGDLTSNLFHLDTEVFEISPFGCDSFTWNGQSIQQHLLLDEL